MYRTLVEQSENKIFLQNSKKCTRWDEIKKKTTHTHTHTHTHTEARSESRNIVRKAGQIRCVWYYG
jgi:uncharacterized membrane protein